MNIESLFEATSFDGILEGSYESESTKLFVSNVSSETDYLDKDDDVAESLNQLTEFETLKQKKIEDKKPYGAATVRRYAHALLGGFSEDKQRMRYREFKQTAKPLNLFSHSTVKSKKSKPEDILRLEQLLAQTYREPSLKITHVESLPVTRKEVKRVFFSMPQGIYQVWVFRADPKKTTRELTAYYLASKHGIPTGKPVGFKPEKVGLTYPYETAILEGVIKHAGDPYDRLIETLSLEPSLIFKTTEGISKLLAKFHTKLTEIKREFEMYGIKLSDASPRKEINERMLKFLNLERDLAEPLILECEKIYNLQEGTKVISHGDIHTGNIVTIARYDPFFGQKANLINRFGIIDFDSLQLDYPQGDLADFWLHHFRKTSLVCSNYTYNYKEFENNYLHYIKQLNLDRAPYSLNNKNSIIQSTLWNVYEMFDPVRKNAFDIKTKAEYHYHNVQNNLINLEEIGLGNYSRKISRYLDIILSLTPYSFLKNK